MKLDGRRESSNVDDRRRMGGGAKAGLGIGAILLAAVVGYFSGGTEGAINAVVNEVTNAQTQTVAPTDREFTAEEQQLATFSSQILAGTEDVWSTIFQEQGWGEYKKPTMVLYTDKARHRWVHSTVRVTRNCTST